MSSAPPSWLIPAHAGKTQAGTYRGMDGGAHPRSRGENSVFWTPPPSQTGSSPLTRGKLARSMSSAPPSWLIPAHAGKTQAGTYRGMDGGAHPRSRGENARSSLPRGRLRGSSPLTRGKQRTGDLVAVQRGLIPAHAGKTRLDSTRVYPRRAHPRSRGENVIAAIAALVAIGSSPLTRGKRGRWWSW